MSRLSIITVNYNETEATLQLLDSIRRFAPADTQVIVVDNASAADPGPQLQSLFPEVKYIRSAVNLGFAGGNQLALPHALGEYLFFVNNDAELTETCVDKMLQVFDNQGHVGILSPLIRYPDGRVQYAGMTAVSSLSGRNRIVETPPSQEPYPTAYAHGAAMMLPRHVCETAGFMWDGFFLYYEELDWCERIRRAGLEVWVCPQATVWHKESLTLNKMGPVKTFYHARNRVLFMRRNRKGWSLPLFYAYMCALVAPAKCLALVARNEWDNARAFLRGLIAGLTAARSTPNP